MTNKFSAYLSIYNDWDLLAPTLHSIRPYIDELVVVDGAYEWMAPYVHAIGHDPLKSDRRVYEAIENAGISFRVISSLWPSEMAKRTAGYRACRNRFIYRIDADEIYHFDENRLSAFLAADGAVAEMEVPLYLSPRWIIASRDADGIGRCGFLFDSAKITAAQHLSYLWLILTVGHLPSGQAERRPVYDQPIAYTAHLSNWRTPTTSVNRAAFYTLNWIRANGAPWFTDLGPRPLHDLTPLFSRVSPNVFLDTLKGHGIVMGCEDLGARILKRAPLVFDAEPKLIDIFIKFMIGLAQTNKEIAENGRYVLGNTHIDLSTTPALRALTADSAINFCLSSNILDTRVSLRYVVLQEPWEIVRSIKPLLSDRRMRVDVPPENEEPPDWLRRIMTVEVRCADGSPVQRLQCC
jgi:hypothetical protein